MSYTPPDPFQHNNSSSNHNRQSSLPTVYEDNDPYRIIKKSPRLGSISDNSDFDAVHSRTASDSSTSRLYTGAMALPSITKENEFPEDPYANKKKWRNNEEQQRTNSYLPYSHHQRDPNQKAEPIYIEEYTAPASTSLGMGSMLHDNMTDQINMRPSSHQQDPTHNPDLFTTDKMVNLTSELKRKRRQKIRCCGLRYRTVALISFLVIAVIVVIWYFVWPRIPELSLDDIDNVGSIQVVTNTTRKSMSTNWLLNMTADNTANWVPTRISSIDLTITDDRSQQIFGNGSSGWRVLPARKKSVLTIPMAIFYASSVVNDTTFQDLYNACGVQVTSNMPFDTKQDVLNVTLHVTFHISGIVWPTTKQMPIRGLACPTS